MSTDLIINSLITIIKTLQVIIESHSSGRFSDLHPEISLRINDAIKKADKNKLMAIILELKNIIKLYK